MSDLSYWLVTWWHDCDYPSVGTMGKEIVAAHTDTQAEALVRYQHKREPGGGYSVTPLDLPDLSRKRKARIIDTGADR